MTIQLTPDDYRVTPDDYREIAELLQLAQADLLATARLADNRNPASNSATVLRRHAGRAADLREMIMRLTK